MDAQFNGTSVRAAKARLGARLGKTWYVIFMVLSVALILGGIGLLVGHSSAGWLLIGLAAVPFMLLEWDKYELEKPKTDERSVDGLIAGDVLGEIGKSPTPQQVANAVSSVPAGMFFAGRFGITKNLLQNVTTDQPADTQMIWQNAVAVRAQTGSPTISGAVLVVAIIQSFPDHEALLAHMQLDMNDLYAGVRWYDHLQELISKSKEPRRTGGIARDFSFGYIPLHADLG